MLRYWEQTDRICLRKEKKEKPIQFICLLTGRLLHISFARQTAEHELTNCGIRSGSTPPPKPQLVSHRVWFTLNPPQSRPRRTPPSKLSIGPRRRHIRWNVAAERKLTDCQERNWSRPFSVSPVCNKHINLACG